MSARADTNCHDIFNFVSATRTHLAKIGATRRVLADMSRHVGDISSYAGHPSAEKGPEPIPHVSWEWVCAIGAMVIMFIDDEKED
jgi:hypothetical protein